ncbi:50S ribosomal protein L2 chloroplastic, partial [Bienertia sinuspersici]
LRIAIDSCEKVEEWDLLWDIQCTTDHGDTFIQNFYLGHKQWSRRQSTRNLIGIISATHRGAGHKCLYHKIDF